MRGLFGRGVRGGLIWHKQPGAANGIAERAVVSTLGKSALDSPAEASPTPFNLPTNDIVLEKCRRCG
jgi:hypothetical protein